MKKKFLHFVFVCLLGNYAYAQSYMLLARTSDGRWRYYNQKGETVYEKKHPVYYHFSEDGIAIAGDDDKQQFTLINKRGEEVITEVPVKLYDDHRYINAWLSDGLLITRHTSKFGCLDTLGRIAIPYKYYHLTGFSNGYGIGRIKREFFVLTTSGEQTRINNDSTIAKAKAFHEGLAIYSNKEGREGFIDTTGRIAIPAQFQGVGFFSNGLAWARRDDGMIGYINPEGKWIIQPTLEAAKPFDKESGLARVKSKMKVMGIDPQTHAARMFESWKWVYMNATGQVVTLDVTDDVRDFSLGLAICKKDGQYGFINKKGEWVIPPKFDDVVDFESDCTLAKLHRLWGIIDRQGNWVLQPKFELVKGGLVKLK